MDRETDKTIGRSGFFYMIHELPPMPRDQVC